MRLEDGLVVFLAIATGGVLLAGLAQALESRRRPPRPRARPRPGAHPGGAASPLPVPPTERLPAADPSGDEAPAGPLSDEVPRPDAPRRHVHEAGGSESGAPVGGALVLAAPAGAPAATAETGEPLADGRDTPSLRPGADDAPDTQEDPLEAPVFRVNADTPPRSTEPLEETPILEVAASTEPRIATPAPTDLVTAGLAAADEHAASISEAPMVPAGEDSTPADKAIPAPPTMHAAAGPRKPKVTPAERATAARADTRSRAARVAARFSPRSGGSASESSDAVLGTAPLAAPRSPPAEGADAPARSTSVAASGVAADATAPPPPPAKRARRSEGRAAPEAGRSERDDRAWARLSAEIDRLIGRALDGAGEAAEGDASLGALAAAAKMLAEAPAESSSVERRQDLAHRLQSAHVALGNARRERGDLEGALGPLSSAVELGAGAPARDREAREALAGAIDALVDRLAEDTRARMRADDLGGAMAASRRLSQVVDDALARGLSPADLAGALARRQAVMLELAEGRPV